MTQSQTNQKNDQPSRPIALDNKTETAKTTNASVANPADMTKTCTTDQKNGQTSKPADASTVKATDTAKKDAA